MTREEILQEAAGNPQYKDVHEFLMAGSINSNLAMDFILQMEPTNAFALWYLFDQVRKKFMTVPGGDLSSSQNRIKKAKIYLLIAAGFVDGDLAEEEDQAIRQIANSFEFRIPDVNYKAIIQEFNLDSAFNALKEANYGERIRLIHAVDYIFKKDGSLKPEERNFMCTLFSQLGVKPSDITEFNPEEYGIRSNISQQGPPPSVQQSATSASPATVQPQREAPSSPAPSAKGRSGCGWLVILGLLLIGGLVWFFFGNNRLKYDSTDVFGYEDLGLSVKWANMNLGAARPEDSGTYYAWGENTSKGEYSWSTYKWCDGDDGSIQNRHLSKYNPNSGYGRLDGKSTLEKGDDAAHQSLSGKWRMPTKAEFQELVDNCKWKWGKVNGVYGYLVTSKAPGRTKNSIFLPAAGIRCEAESFNVGESSCYWSSTLNESEPNRAYYLSISKMSHGTDGYYRFYGYPIRAVWDEKEIEDEIEEVIEEGRGSMPDEYL